MTTTKAGVAGGSDPGLTRGGALGARPGSKRLGRSTTRRVLNSALMTVFVAVVILFILGPLVWLAIRAFATNYTFPRLVPDGWTIHWFGVVFSNHDLLTSVINSLIISPIVLVCAAVICLPAAYAFGRSRFFGRKTMLVSLFATNAFPKMGLFATLASLFYALNIMGSIVGIVIVQLLGTLVYMTWIPAAAFAAVPRNLEEAARDCGASRLRVFFTITLRYALPGVLVASIMSFLAAFDESQGTYLVGAPSIYTMPTEMYSLVLNYPSQVAAVFSIIMTIPSVVLMLFARKYIIGGQLAEGFQLR